MIETIANRYVFTRNWADRGQANWHEHLAYLAGKPFTYLEIGVFEGRSGCWMLDDFLTHPSSRYIGIDLWEFDRRYDGKQVEARARANLSRHAAKAELLKGPSHWLLRSPRWLPATIDVGLIDGDHGATGVLSDSVLVWPLVKPGGVMIWDDYCDRRRHRGIRKAADAFLSCIEGSYLPLFQSRQQLAIRKLPDDSGQGLT